MSLSDLVKKDWVKRLATATVATVATDKPFIAPTVAKVATVAVAQAETSKTVSAETTAFDAAPTTTEGQHLPQADIGTIRPPGMTDRFLAASQALDRQIADEDLQQREGMARAAMAEVLALFAKSKPTPTDPHRFDSAPIPAPRPAPAAKPKPDNWFHVDAPWRPLAKAYYAHHVACKACIGAGQGRGQQCDTGAALWTAYQVQTND